MKKSQSPGRLRLRSVGTALLAAFWLISFLPIQAAPQTLKGHVPAITKHLAPVGDLNERRRMNLAIGLPLRNGGQLTNFLQDLYEPATTKFRHYLSADEFTAAYGPSQEDYQAVIDFAKARGLTVRYTHRNRTLLDVTGTVADIEKAFHVKMRVYQHPIDGHTFYAPDTEPSVDLSTPLLAISGLDNYKKPRPQIHAHGGPFEPLVRPLGGGGSGGGGGGSGGTGPGGTYIGYDFLSAYAPGVTNDGAGQTLGLFELSGYDPQDISDYESEAGLPGVPLQNVLVDGFDGDDTNIDYALEVTGDIEMAEAMAPGLSNILVYEGPTPLDVAPLDTNYIQPDFTTAEINDVLNRMATDDLAQQLSCSYEMDINLSTIQIFQQYAAQGQSFFQGSGDSGAYAGAVDEPADDPYLTVVGGTTLSTSSQGGPWSREAVWLTPASDDPLFGYSPEEASGGGISLTYPIPSWQQGVSMTANQGSTTMRNLPDVTLVANNVDVVWGNDYLTFSYDFPTAGTSLSTPLWAGFMALVNQQAAANHQPPVGFANPALYAIGRSSIYTSCFHDIKSGNNFTTNMPNRYSATTGYDLCSGWGSMIASNLIPALLSPPSENLVVNPPLGFVSFGPVGGPYNVTSQTYMLTNIGDSLLNWSVSSTAPWLNVSATSGELQPGAPAQPVTVTLNARASGYLMANLGANVGFVDTTDGITQNRQFNLDMGNGGFETGDLTNWTFIGQSDLDFDLAGDDIDVAGTNALDGNPDWLFVHSGLYGAYLGEFPDTGLLAQTLPTQPGELYQVSFWLTSVPYQGSTTPNDFTVVWDDIALFTQTNLADFGWTNLQYIVPATRLHTILAFEFNNTPAGFGLDDITVEPLPAPTVQSAILSAGNVTLTWSSISNFTYEIQSATSLSSRNWTNVIGTVTANGSTTTADAPANSTSQQYYRVVMVVP